MELPDHMKNSDLRSHNVFSFGAPGDWKGYHLQLLKDDSSLPRTVILKVKKAPAMNRPGGHSRLMDNFLAIFSFQYSLYPKNALSAVKTPALPSFWRWGRDFKVRSALFFPQNILKCGFR